MTAIAILGVNSYPTPYPSAEPQVVVPIVDPMVAPINVGQIGMPLVPVPVGGFGRRRRW